MTNESTIIIAAGSTGFAVGCGYEQHYVATFEQLTELLDRLIVSRGRGKSARYEIRGVEVETASNPATENQEGSNERDNIHSST